jgi:hypothetical protein
MGEADGADAVDEGDEGDEGDEADDDDEDDVVPDEHAAVSKTDEATATATAAFRVRLPTMGTSKSLRNRMGLPPDRDRVATPLPRSTIVLPIPAASTVPCSERAREETAVPIEGLTVRPLTGGPIEAGRVASSHTTTTR